MGKRSFYNGNEDEKPLYMRTPMITLESNQLFFEFGTEITNDVAEAVAIMIFNKVSFDDPIWNTFLGNVNDVNPIRSLYWLTGGIDVWGYGRTKIDCWSDCGRIYEEEYGDDIIDIVSKSKKLSDIRNGFLHNIRLYNNSYSSGYKYCG